jgi:hypothetical protein
MTNIVSFSDNGCGGILCALLNNEPLIFYNTNAVNSPTHKELKIKNIEEFNRKVEQLSNNNLWYGTHNHPSIFLSDNNIHKIIYINQIKPESKVWLSLRLSCNKDGFYENSFIDFLINLFLKNNNIWTTAINDDKIISCELYDFINDINYRLNLFNELGILYDENKFQEWISRNNFMPYMENGMKIYHTLTKNNS